MDRLAVCPTLLFQKNSEEKRRPRQHILPARCKGGARIDAEVFVKIVKHAGAISEIALVVRIQTAHAASHRIVAIAECFPPH